MIHWYIHTTASGFWALQTAAEQKLVAKEEFMPEVPTP